MEAIISTAQASGIERYRNSRIKAKTVCAFLFGLLLGAFAGWCGSWLVFGMINGG